MSIAENIREQVEHLLRHEIALDDFEDWFLSHTWDAHLVEQEPVVRLIHHIGGTLVDYSSGAIGLPSLHRELANAVRSVAGVWGEPLSERPRNEKCAAKPVRFSAEYSLKSTAVNNAPSLHTFALDECDNHLRIGPYLSTFKPPILVEAVA